MIILFVWFAETESPAFFRSCENKIRGLIPVLDDIVISEEYTSTAMALNALNYVKESTGGARELKHVRFSHCQVEPENLDMHGYLRSMRR